MVTRLLAPAVTIASLLGAAVGTTWAAPGGSTVSGVVELADLAQRPERPVRSRGFVRRVRGPLKPPKKGDPRDRIVVVLQGGPVAAEDKKPPGGSLRYEIVGESFAAPVFPFVAGAKIEIRNSSDRPVHLWAPSAEDLIDDAPLAPKRSRAIGGKLSKPLAAVEIRDRESAHLRGELLPLPHPYFSLLDASGKYEIKGVPPGTWKVKLWYRGGFIDLGGQVTVEVSGRTSKAPTIKLPPSPQREGEKGRGDK